MIFLYLLLTALTQFYNENTTEITIETGAK